jgi:hypothetical protein
MMGVRCAARTVLLTVALLAPPAACDFHFTDPLGESPAALSLTVQFEQGPGDRLVVQGPFSPGRDEAGHVRGVAQEALRIGAASLHPVGFAAEGALRYEGEVAVPAAGDGLVLDLGVPEVNGVSVPDPVLRFGVCRRVGGEEVTLGDDGVVRLEAECPRGPGIDAPASGTWELLVGPGDQGSLLRIQGVGDPPTSFEIPAALLPQGGSEEPDATLIVFQRTEWDEPSGRYLVRVQVISHLTWAILPASPPSG